METLFKQSITIDLKKTTNLPTPQFIQQDTSVLEFNILENGEEADLGNIGRIVVNYKRGDRVVISRLLTKEGNKVTYEIGTKEMEVSGYGEVELQFFNEDNTQRVSTKRFKVHVTGSIGSTEVQEGGKQFTLLQELFVDVDDAITKTKVAEEKALEEANFARTKGNYANEKAQEASLAAINADLVAGSLNTFKTDVTKLKNDTATVKADAETQAAFAKTQGDYAKREADRLVNTDVSVLDNKIGNTANLATQTKSSIVGSVNEISDKIGNLLDKNTQIDAQLADNRQHTTNAFKRLQTKLPIQHSFVYENMEDLSGWTAQNATISADKVNKSQGSQSMKITSTPGTLGRAVKNVEYPFTGKYFRFWVNIPDISKVKNIGLILYFNGSTQNYYGYNFTKADNQIYQGVQQFDFHISKRAASGTIDPNTYITRIDFYVNPETASDVGEASFDLLENVSRKPVLLFANDAPYLEFTEDVAPLLKARNLPYNIQMRKEEIDNAVANPGTALPGRISFNQLKEQHLKYGAEIGLHVDCLQTNDSDFKLHIKDLLKNTLKLGVLPSGFHVSALTNRYTNSFRRDYISQFAGTMRRAADLPWFSGDFNKRFYNPPSAHMLFKEIPNLEFDHNTTAEIAAKWITDAIETETSIYVFGHGTNRLSTNYRTPLSVYQAFFETLDSNKDKIDVLSLSEFYSYFKDTREDVNRLKTPFSY